MATMESENIITTILKGQNFDLCIIANRWDDETSVHHELILPINQAHLVSITTLRTTNTSLQKHLGTTRNSLLLVWKLDGTLDQAFCTPEINCLILCNHYLVYGRSDLIELRNTTSPFEQDSYIVDTCTITALCSAGDCFVAAKADGTISCWDEFTIPFNTCAQTLRTGNPPELILCLCYADNTLFVGVANRIEAWKLSEPNSPIAVLENHTGRVTSLCVWDNVLVSASWDHCVMLWDSTACIQTLKGHSDKVMCLCVWKDCLFWRTMQELQPV